MGDWVMVIVGSLLAWLGLQGLSRGIGERDRNRMLQGGTVALLGVLMAFGLMEQGVRWAAGGLGRILARDPSGSNVLVWVMCGASVLYAGKTAVDGRRQRRATGTARAGRDPQDRG
jgi:uncharacterized membrane protein